MSSAQRIAVWNGERAQTTGGLKKADLMRNRHGRIVSKKKSEVARKLNNLGNFLASKAKGKAAEPKAAPKPKPKQPKPVVQKPKPVVPKPKPKPKPKPVVQKPKPKPVPKPVKNPYEGMTPKQKRKAMMAEAMRDKGYIKKITQDPDVIAERKRSKRHTGIDPANIIPNQRAGIGGKYLKKAPKQKKPPRFETIDLTGGRLKKITQKQLDRAKKKPVPRRPKKRRRKKTLPLGLMV